MIVENFKQVRQRIILAAERAGRDPADVRLVAVTKELSTALVAEGLRSGSEIFGENKIK